MKITPLITEKTTEKVGEGKYTFLVDRGATKHEIKEGVESLFGVDVVRVWTIRRKAQEKRDPRRRGKKRVIGAYKKAIVKLGEKQKIDLFEEKGK